MRVPISNEIMQSEIVRNLCPLCNSFDMFDGEILSDLDMNVLKLMDN